MNIIFLLGTKSEVNAQRFREQVDSVNVSAYSTVTEMMNMVTNRNDTFDRLVVSTSSLADQKTMQVLHKFVRELHPRATVVYIFRSGVDDALSRTFSEIFNSPLYTDVEIKTNSIKLLEEIATGGIDGIREKYSINNNLGAEDTLEDSYDPSETSDGVSKDFENEGSPMVNLPQNRKTASRFTWYGLRKLNKKQIAIYNENRKLIIEYIKYLMTVEDEVEEKENRPLPDIQRRSQSNPIVEYETEVSKGIDNKSTSQELTKNQFNPVSNPSFTQLELGYYGFSTSFNGRPMMFRTGINVTQKYAS